jgi:hypothetical protein
MVRKDLKRKAEVNNEEEKGSSGPEKLQKSNSLESEKAFQ